MGGIAHSPTSAEISAGPAFWRDAQGFCTPPQDSYDRPQIEVIIRGDWWLPLSTTASAKRKRAGSDETTRVALQQPRSGGGTLMLRVWGRNNSINVQKVMWTVGELALAHERIDVGGAFGGLDTAEYGRLNPNRRIPTVEDGDVVVWESNACVRYLAARYGAGRLWPGDPRRRAQADMWMDWQVSTLLPDMTVVFWGLIRTPEAERDYPAIEAAARRLRDTWRILEQHLSNRRYVAGDTLTIGDIPLGASCYRYYGLPIERPQLANIERWYGRLQRRAPFREHVMLPIT